jgi:hypothetical protein
VQNLLKCSKRHKISISHYIFKSRVRQKRLSFCSCTCINLKKILRLFVGSKLHVT